MRHGRQRNALLVAIGGIVALVALGVVAIYTPRVADHFGYVTPLTGRLPARVTYAGRRYAATSACASEETLSSHHLWPLAAVGSVPILFGGSRPLLSPPVPAGLTRMELAVAAGACYQLYTIEGGP